MIIAISALLSPFHPYFSGKSRKSTFTDLGFQSLSSILAVWWAYTGSLIPLDLSVGDLYPINLIKGVWMYNWGTPLIKEWLLVQDLQNIMII